MIALVAVGIAGVHSGARAQDGARRVTLAEALRLFGENNLELRLSRANSQEAAGLARQSAAVPNPVLNLTHEALSGGGTAYSETYFNATQRIDWLWQRGARTAEAEELLLASLAGFQVRGRSGRTDNRRRAFGRRPQGGNRPHAGRRNDYRQGAGRRRKPA